MTMLPQQLSQFVNPDLANILAAHKRDILTSINCVQAGTIVSFDAGEQSATVRVNMQRLVYNQQPTPENPAAATPLVVDYPLLLKCPVFVTQGGGGALTFPIYAGDTCLILFNDRDIDNWWMTGGTSPPNTNRLHDLSDGFCLVGVRSSANLIAGYSTTDAELKYNGGRIQVSEKIGINNDSMSLLTALNAVITALNSLNSVKAGGDASVAITAASAAINAVLK